MRKPVASFDAAFGRLGIRFTMLRMHKLSRIQDRPRRFSARGSAIWPVTGLIATGLFVAGLWMSLTRPANIERVSSPAAQFKLIDGQVLSLAALRGKVVLVDFWATSCAICLVELPGVARMGTDLADRGLVVVAVAMPYDRPDYVMDYARTSGLKLNIALDPVGDVIRQFAPVRGTPTVILIDRRGQIVERLEGPVNIDKLRAKVQVLLDVVS